MVEFVIKDVDLGFSLRRGIINGILSKIEQHLLDTTGITDQVIWQDTGTILVHVLDLGQKRAVFSGF